MDITEAKYSFYLNEVEEKAFDDFQERQTKKEVTRMGAIGGRFGITFYPTGLGPVIIVTDAQLKEEENITDFSCW
jgi:hypothetical protein